MENQTSKIDVSIIIVNYKSWKHLKNCLQSLSFDSSSFSFEIIVVDNHSDDGVLIDFEKEFSKVNFILNSGNNGFANGCNFGSTHANGDYFLFLNPDTIANEDAILKMWKFAKMSPSTGIVSCQQRKIKGGYEKSARIFPNLFTLFGLTRAIYKRVNRKQIHSKFEIQNNILFPDWVSGSVVFISKEWLNQVGGWDEDYWMYYEDMDLCKRVQVANGKIALLKSVEIIHNHGGASRINIKTASITKNEVLISKHVYIHNNFKGFEKFLSQLLIVINNIVIKLLLAVLGTLLFFIPKMRLNVYLFANCIKYYTASIFRLSWLSKKSMNVK
tara:strand:- start:79300 stop:80286 length:987 start_codon:yes stop_codon:yes gene_type:complete